MNCCVAGRSQPNTVGRLSGQRIASPEPIDREAQREREMLTAADREFVREHGGPHHCDKLISTVDDGTEVLMGGSEKETGPPPRTVIAPAEAI